MALLRNKDGLRLVKGNIPAGLEMVEQGVKFMWEHRFIIVGPACESEEEARALATTAFNEPAPNSTFIPAQVYDKYNIGPLIRKTNNGIYFFQLVSPRLKLTNDQVKN